MTRESSRELCRRPLLELLEARLVFASDFGDAPLPYPTLFSEGGAEHVAIGPMLGASRDAEADGVHSPAANGDDTTGIDDEDGVTFGTVRAGALDAAVIVNVQGGPGKLDAWIDFNHDGAWGGPGEQIANNVSVVSGNNAISFDVPSSALDGTTIARFRLSTAGNLGVGGFAADGEVEDHAVTLSPPRPACGCFGAPTDFHPEGMKAPRSVYAVDVDGDGDTDVLSASSGDDTIAWYENDGNEVFTTHVITSNANGAYSVYAADVDSDGDIDALSASSLDNKIAWYENDGNENFTPRIITTTAMSAMDVYATDLDGDGDTDVISASYADDKIAWYENDGNENFATHIITASADRALSVYAADVDGDGDTDVLSAARYDGVAWHENDGIGNFTSHFIADPGGTRSVYARDVDGDGDTDVLSADYNFILWYENDGNQDFTSHRISATGQQFRDVYAVDVDADGDTDVLSASYSGLELGWYENDGNQDFVSHSITTAIAGTEAVFATDVDGDTDIDVLSASFNDNKIAWYENDGDQNFTAFAINVAPKFANSVYVVDMDNDADMDVLFASYHLIGWYENDGNNNFTLHPITMNAKNGKDVYAVDIDGDGDMDVLSAASLGGIAWYENDGNQNFTSHAFPGGYAMSIRAADVDGDGDIDMLAAFGSGDKKIVWYENNGSQGFLAQTIANNVQGAASVDTADVDGDGDLDALSASSINGAILWYENDGNENFAVHIITGTAFGTQGVFAVDLDRDGDTDVLSASGGIGKIGWYENDGNANFTTHSITNSNTALSVYAADLDGDGDIDVVSALSNDRVAWHENDGSQNFTQHLISTADGVNSVFAADIDNDGDLDALSASMYDDRVTWYENLNFVVVNTNDAGPGSLRQAIQQANANPGLDTITFAIGAGYQTIAPTSALPTLTDSVIIDGTTQPGYAGSPLIEVWGFAAGPNVDGLTIVADDSIVKGILVNLFDGNGILITGDNNRIENSYIGADVSGTIAVPNALNGVEISGSNNTIGGTDPGTANVIAFNGGQGVLVDTGTGNAIRRNSIHSNDGFGIGLINGGNNNQAAPTVTRWSSTGGTTKVWLTLTSTPNTTFSIDVFRNIACDPSGFGEGEAFLGTAVLTTNAGGSGSVIAAFGVGTSLKQFLTATATSPANDTSDFSNCIPFRPKAPVTAGSVPPLPTPPISNGHSVTNVGVQHTLDLNITPPILPAPPASDPAIAVHVSSQTQIVVRQPESNETSTVDRPPSSRRITRLTQPPSDIGLLDALFSESSPAGV